MPVHVMNSRDIFPKLLECGRGIDSSVNFLSFELLSRAEDAVDMKQSRTKEGGRCFYTKMEPCFERDQRNSKTAALPLFSEVWKKVRASHILTKWQDLNVVSEGDQ